LEEPKLEAKITTPKPNPSTISLNNRSRSSSPPAKALKKITPNRFVPVSDGNKALNLDVSNFISERGSKRANSLPLSPGVISPHQTEKEVQESLLSRHTSLCNIFQSRLSSIRCVREVWDDNNIKAAVEVLTRTREPALWIDILRILNLRPRLLSLEVAILLLPVLRDLLFEVFEDYIITCCDTIKLLMKCFSGVISSTLTNVDFSGIDISREERYYILLAYKQNRKMSYM
jgi:katanin p80 WD40 repeat-containing subunit B1